MDRPAARFRGRGEKAMNDADASKQPGAWKCPHCGYPCPAVWTRCASCAYVLPDVPDRKPIPTLNVKPVARAAGSSVPHANAGPASDTRTAAAALPQHGGAVTAPSPQAPAAWSTPPAAQSLDTWRVQRDADRRHRDDLVRDELLRAALARSYTTPAVITLFLYCTFYVPGLLANLMYFFSARADRDLTGIAPQGMGYLTVLLWCGIVPPVLLFLLISALIASRG